MGETFTVGVTVRSYEIDVNGHVNHAVYHQYGEHARTQHMAAAGCTVDRMLERRMGAVLLETHVRFLRELRHGDEVVVESRLTFGEGKTFAFDQTIRRADGVVAAEIECRLGLIDADARRLLADPHARMLEVATNPALLG